MQAHWTERQGEKLHALAADKRYEALKAQRTADLDARRHALADKLYAEDQALRAELVSLRAWAGRGDAAPGCLRSGCCWAVGRGAPTQVHGCSAAPHWPSTSSDLALRPSLAGRGPCATTAQHRPPPPTCRPVGCR